MTRKREVLDARFRDRDAKKSAERDSDEPRQSRGGPRPELPASPKPWWMTGNAIIPGVLTVFLGWALYEKYKPAPPPTVATAASAGDAEPGGAADASELPPILPPDNAPTAPPARDAEAVFDAGIALDPNPVVPAHAEPTSPDPRGGHFSIAQATEGLAGEGPLHADIVTSMGSFDCELLAQQAPVTVANFVGLARGLRDFWDPVAGSWARRPFYAGSIFHRVIPGFMIQGGDILRSGTGDPGYEIPDENVRSHDAAGLLCMANHGPNTNGAQFFITEAPRAELDGNYTIFGRCTPTPLVARITGVDRDPRDRPRAPVYILRVDIRRGAHAAP